MSVRAVLFDAGNTLLFLEYPRLAREVGLALGIPLEADRLAGCAAEAAFRLEQPGGGDHDRASRYLESLFLLAGVPEARLHQVRDTLLALHRQRHLWSGMDQDTPAALERLSAAGFRLGVVSNSDGRAADALAAVGIGHHFEIVVDSHLVGIEKPDPAIFQEALRQLALTPGEALYVGDIYQVDAVGARAAGLEVILVDPAGRHAHRDVPTVASVARAADWILARYPGPSAES